MNKKFVLSVILVAFISVAIYSLTATSLLSKDSSKLHFNSAAIKEMNPDMPVILVTGFTDILGDDHKRRRANLILAKPFSHDNLREAVGRAVAAA